LEKIEELEERPRLRWGKSKIKKVKRYISKSQKQIRIVKKSSYIKGISSSSSSSLINQCYIALKIRITQKWDSGDREN
jgi:hypothetical protein